MNPDPAAQLQRKDATYRIGDLVVCPVHNDALLASMYLRFRQEGLLPIIFHESGEEPPDLTWFLKTYLDPANSSLGCFLEKGGQVEPCGLCWVNQVYPISDGRWKKAEVGLAFFRHQPPERLLTFGRMVQAWAFEQLGLDTLFGTTPEPNRAAVQFGKNLGFHQVVLPGYTAYEGRLCGAVIQWMTRTEFEERASGEE